MNKEIKKIYQRLEWLEYAQKEILGCRREIKESLVKLNRQLKKNE